jgi:signal peptidase I
MYPFLKPGDRLVVKRIHPNYLQVGDIIVMRRSKDHITAHRIVRMLSNGNAVTKGDSLLVPDNEQIKLSEVDGRVEAVVRGRKLIPVSTGPRSWGKGLYAILSVWGLTYGAIKIKVKNVLKKMLPLHESNGPDREREFIAAFISGRSPETPPNLDWTKLTKMAIHEGVAGMLYYSLKEKNLPLPVPSRFEDSYHSTAALNLIHINFLEKLEERLSKEKIEVLALKGGSLLDNIYPGIGMRPMGDLDLMIRPESYEKFAELLCSMGYQTDPWIPHFFIKGKHIIDIHTHYLNTDRIACRESLFPAGMEPIWLNSVPWRKGFRWLKRPDEIDNVLLLSQHLLKHSFDKLFWLVDIHLLLQGQDSLSWKKLADRAEYLDQNKPLSYVLYLLDRSFGFSPPEGSGFSPLLNEISGIERMMLDIRLTGRPFEQFGPLLSLFCISGFKERFRFGWETLFPRREIIKEEFGKSFGGKWKLAYLYRVSRIAILACKQFPIIVRALLRGQRQGPT